MTLLSEPTFFHFDFTFIYKQFTRSGCFTLGRLKATGFIGARVRTTKLPILRVFFSLVSLWDLMIGKETNNFLGTFAIEIISFECQRKPSF
jgi:hypothetical protein